MRDNSLALLSELDALAERMASALERVRAFRTTLAKQLAGGDAPIDLAALQRLAEETDRLTATGAEGAADAVVLVRQLRP
jgi:hypothetical protein